MTDFSTPVLGHLSPRSVFSYFEALCAIPHGSGNVAAISDFCAEFAREKGLRFVQDEMHNVIIFKEGSAGREGEAPVIFQGHLDMVCEKDADCDLDFTRDGLRLFLDGDKIGAKGTTLGGDDGIAVAFGLALLADETLSHPPLEVVFTTDEETGMYGAAALDASVLRGRKLLNMDSEEEGIFTVSCAGGGTAVCRLPMEWEDVQSGQILAAIQISGLHGGHSGIEIHKGYANASKLMGRLLADLAEVEGWRLADLAGGKKDNAIPVECRAVVAVAPAQLPAVKEIAARAESTFRQEFAATEPGLSVTVTEGSAEQAVLDGASTLRAVQFLTLCPNGVQNMSREIEGLVKTSLNLGILQLHREGLVANLSTRSSQTSEREALIGQLVCLTGLLGGEVTRVGDYPAWEYRHDAPLRDKMVEIYRKMFGVAPKIEAIHAGLECGIFCGKLPGLECVSFGPNLTEIHTPRERMSVASVQRMWEFVREILAQRL